MAYEIPVLPWSLPANVDLSSYQFACVRVLAATNTTGTGVGGAAVDLVSASGDDIIGFLQNKPVLGEAASIMSEGITKANAGETIAIGDQLMSLPSGKVGKATTGKYIIAVALESAADNDVFTVLIKSNGKV